jgi:MFS family permease
LSKLYQVVTEDLFPFETRAVVSLASLYVLRMLGLFMVLPVFALYAEGFEGVTPLLIGLALGAYGFTQGIFQIPFGMLSDRIGRKQVIAGGLLLFAAGSVVAAMADSIYGVIIGRFLQGSGAIASTVMALVADLTSEENRTKAMASIGASIGVSFAISLVLGPMLSAYGGVAGIFWVTALLALLGIFILFLAVPHAPKAAYTTRDVSAVPELFGSVLRDGSLVRLNLGIFSLHFVLMAVFLVLPLLLRDVANLAPKDHWQVYLPMMFFAFIAMLPAMIVAEKKHKVKPVFLLSIVLLSVAMLLLSKWHGTAFEVYSIAFVFFTAFNLLEALLPSLVSKEAAAGSRGTAMGVYSSCQFFGAFAGGMLGGAIMQYWNLNILLQVCAAVGLVWFVFALTMPKPRRLRNMAVSLDEINEDTSARLLAVEGVEEVMLMVSVQRAYLKIDVGRLDEAALRVLTNTPDKNSD